MRLLHHPSTNRGLCSYRSFLKEAKKRLLNGEDVSKTTFWNIFINNEFYLKNIEKEINVCVVSYKKTRAEALIFISDEFYKRVYYPVMAEAIIHHHVIHSNNYEIVETEDEFDYEKKVDLKIRHKKLDDEMVIQIKSSFQHKSYIIDEAVKQKINLGYSAEFIIVQFKSDEFKKGLYWVDDRAKIITQINAENQKLLSQSTVEDFEKLLDLMMAKHYEKKAGSYHLSQNSLQFVI